MNCPMCGSEIPNGVKYCPVCGGDVEVAAQRAQQVPVQPTVPYAAPVTQTGAQRAVPMNHSIPQAQPAAPLKEIDTGKLEGSPKWPIVLIVVLLVVIAALLLLIFHPWSNGATTTPTGGDQVVVSTTPTTGEQTVQEGQTQQAPTVDETTVAPAVNNDAEVYAQLASSFDQLAGFHNQISSIATDFSNTIGTGSMADIRNRAADLQSQISAASAALAAVDVAADSPYAANKAAIGELYNDLAMRIGVLVEACDADMNGQDYSAVLSRDNGAPDEHGHTNIYLIHYEQNYEAARPAAPQA